MKKGFWNWMVNLPLVLWFENLAPCKAVLNTSWGKKIFCKEPISYIFYGVLTTIVDFVIFGIFELLLAGKIILDILGNTVDIGYLVSTMIAWIAAVAFAFVTNKLFVFESKSLKPKLVAKEFILFVGSRIASLLFTLLWMYAAVTLMKMNEWLAKILGNIVVMIMNYVLSKLFIFKTKKENEGV